MRHARTSGAKTGKIYSQGPNLAPTVIPFRPAGSQEVACIQSPSLDNLKALLCARPHRLHQHKLTDCLFIQTRASPTALQDLDNPGPVATAQDNVRSTTALLERHTYTPGCSAGALPKGPFGKRTALQQLLRLQRQSSTSRQRWRLTPPRSTPLPLRNPPVAGQQLMRPNPCWGGWQRPASDDASQFNIASRMQNTRHTAAADSTTYPGDSEQGAKHRACSQPAIHATTHTVQHHNRVSVARPDICAVDRAA